MAITVIITIRGFDQHVCWNTGGANELNHGFRVIVEIVAKRDSTLEPVKKYALKGLRSETANTNKRISFAGDNKSRASNSECKNRTRVTVKKGLHKQMGTVFAHFQNQSKRHVFKKHWRKN